LFSASENNVIINVRKCTNGNATISKIEDAVNVSVNETEEENETAMQNFSVNYSVGETQNTTNTSGGNNEGNISQSSEKISKNMLYILIGAIILMLAVLSVFLIKYLKPAEQNKTI
jgi:hypothetical protein